MKTLNGFKRFIVITLAFLFTIEPIVEARSRRAAGCGAGMATSTVYNVPKFSDYCKGTAICPAFRRAVRMEGSGVLPGGKTLDYRGKIKSDPDCNTARGAWSDCLMPFLSVAADRNYYRRGDIISMPGLKGKEIRLPDGKIMTHPGYMIVQDVGGAIKGPNRFDFFVGTYKVSDPLNKFGDGGDLKMVGKGDCQDYKRFSVIRAPVGKRGLASDQYSGALAQIEKSYSGAGELSETRTASLEDNSTGVN